MLHVCCAIQSSLEEVVDFFQQISLALRSVSSPFIIALPPFYFFVDKNGINTNNSYSKRLNQYLDCHLVSPIEVVDVLQQMKNIKEEKLFLAVTT